MSFLSELSDFLFPRFCLTCNEKLNTNQKYFCLGCSKELKEAETHFIKKEYQRKFASDNIISGLFSLYVFEADQPIQDIIHHLKYGKRFRAGIFLGKQVGEKLLKVFPESNIDIFIPVPLFHSKEAERGFNQSDFIARGISKVYGKPVKTDILKRVKNTKTQTKLNITERMENMDGAFIISNPEIIRGKTIAMADDVITTGATIKECAKVLKQNGAKDVFAVSVAITNI